LTLQGEIVRLNQRKLSELQKNLEYLKELDEKTKALEGVKLNCFAG